MLNPQTEIKISDYNSLYDILNPTVNGFAISPCVLE